MNRNELIRYLISTIREIVEAMGEQVSDITESTKPIGGIGQFDSLTGVTLTAVCFDKYGIGDNVGTNIVNICVGEEHGVACALTVGEIANRILDLVKKGAEK
jgi:hypothetical protein